MHIHAMTPLPPLLMSKQGFQIPFSMRNAKNQHVIILDGINDDVFAHRKTARTNTEVNLASAAQIGVAGKKEKSVSNGNQPTGWQLRCCRSLSRRSTRCHRDRWPLAVKRGAPLAGRRLFGGKPRLAAPFHFLRDLPHRLLGDDASLATSKGGLGVIETCQKLRSLAFPLLPQCQSFLYRILGTVEPGRLDGLTNERFLIGRQMYFHRLRA
jgi:hypothetical protein